MVHDIDKIKAKVKTVDNINANVSNTIQRVTYETEEITVTPKTEKQVIKPTKGKFINKVTANPVTAAIDSDIQADNIKKGINILGVDGTYVGTDTTDATATANDIINPKTAYVSGEKVTGTIQVEYRTGDYNIVGSVLSSITFTNPTFDFKNKIVVDWVYDKTQFTIYKYNDSYIVTNTKTITLAAIGLSEKLLNSISVAYNDASYNTRVYISAANSGETTYMYLAYIDFNLNLDIVVYKTHILNSGMSYITSGRISAIPKNYDKFLIQYHYDNGAETNTCYSVVKEFNIINGEFQELYSTENSKLIGNWVYRQNSNVFDVKYSKDGKYVVLYSYYQRLAGYFRTTRIIDISNGFSVLKYWGEEKHCYFLGDKIVIDTSIYMLPNLTASIGTGLALTNATSRTLGDYVTYWVDSSNIQIIGFDESTSKTKAIKALAVKTTGVSPYTCDSYGAVYLQISGVYVLENTITGIPDKINVKGNTLYNTSDTTAGADDILFLKTAYANGNKVTGTIKNNGALNYTPSTSSQTIPTGYTSGGTVAAVTSSIDSNIVAENIKLGITILGVTGTYTGETGEDTGDKPLYTEINYIGLSGTQYINTEIPLWSYTNWSVEMDFMLDKNYDFNHFLSVNDSDSKNEIWSNVYGKYDMRFNNTKVNPFDNLSISTRYVIKHNYNTGTIQTYLNSVLKNTYNFGTINLSGNIRFGKRSSNYFYGRLYSLKLWANGDLVREFIPVKDSKNVVCLYDKVSGEFFYNAGTGSFKEG